MYLRIHVIVWSLLIWSSSLSLRDEVWDRILPEMTTLCPNVDFCGKTEVTKPHNTGINACCRGCSCLSNCSKTRDCCDGTGNDDALSKCLVPSTNQDKRMNLYHFVVEQPTDGCKMSSDQTQTNVTCSPDEKVAPWGNFLPVYSKSLDKNFKNEPCARCHGAIDVEEWTSLLYVENAPFFIGTIAEFIETNNMNDCYVVFKPPNTKSSKFEKRCFREKSACPRGVAASFYVTSNLQMDRETIINACEEGPSARYIGSSGRAFKNVFCAICNGNVNRFTDKLICQNTDDKELNQPIRIFLDPTYMSSIGTDLDSKQNDADQCYRPENSKNKSICESLRCPSMQLRRSSGKCGYAARFVMVEHLVLCLNVSTHDTGNYDANKMTHTQVFALFEESSPWSKRWFITYIGVLVTDKPGWLGLLVCLKLKENQINMDTLRQEIETSLVKKWKINLNSPLAFDQTITRHGRVENGFGFKNMTALWAVYTSEITADLKPPTWKNLYIQDFRLRSPLLFNQMFICEQIQLHPSEYKIDSYSPGAVLYLLDRQTHLYPNQFTMFVDDDGDCSVRVCLKDSGYVKVINCAGTSHNVDIWILITLTFYKFSSVFTETA